jgi:hypothetical protein
VEVEEEARVEKYVGRITAVMAARKIAARKSRWKTCGEGFIGGRVAE